MGMITEAVDSIRAIKFRDLISQIVTLGLIFSSALVIWKGLILISGSKTPIVVVLSESMEPGFQRGDILFLHMNKDPIRAGEIVVYNIDGRPIPIVHRVIEVHEQKGTSGIDILTKGDNNLADDRQLYADGQIWLEQQHILGKAIGFLPYIGYLTIVMTDHAILKYILVGILALLVITSKE